MITLNGKATDGFDGETVMSLLESNGYKLSHIAVELNGEILKKDLYATAVLKEGDRLEVVCFVGGG